MPIDPRIALGVQPLQLPMQNPNAQMNMLAQALQLKSGMSQMQAAEQERAERNALNEAYRGALGSDGAVDRNMLTRTLADRGLGARIPALQKQWADVDKATADVGKTKADTEKANLEVAHRRVDSWGQAMGFVRQNPTPENAAAAVQHLVRLGVMPPEMAQAALAQVQQNPQGVAQWADMGFRAALSAKDQLPTFETRNTGQTTDTMQIDPVTGKMAVVGRLQNTASPGDVLQAQTSTANNQRSVAAQYDLNRATREAAATNAAALRDAASIKDKRDTEMKLGDDYRAQSKPFKEVADAYKIITSSLDKATTSPAATLAGATKFMKLLDPGSVVRESELGMALAAAGVLDRAANYYNTLQRGKVLTEKQAADFKNIAAQIYKAAQDGQKQVDANYARQADQYGLRKDMIVQDLGQNTPVPVDLGSLPSAGGGGNAKPRELQWGK